MAGWFAVFAVLAIFGSVLGKKDDGNLDNLISEDKCAIYMYSDGGEVLVEKGFEKEKKKYWERYAHFNISAKPKHQADCKNETAESKSLTLTYSDTGSQNVTGLTLRFEIKTKGKSWNVKGLTASLTGAQKVDDIKLSTKYLHSTTQFSYSCLNMTLWTAPNRNNTHRVTLTLNRFQLQPFKHKSNNTIFVESEDCSTWFTIPLWMGFFTILLLTSILAMGIYMLLDIKTMDRFENPKSKTITISATD